MALPLPRRILLLAGLGLLGGAAASAAARAQTSPPQAAWPAPYEVSDIEVEVTGARSGVAAKDEAYLDALRRAWLRMKLDFRQPAVRATDAEILDMVASVIVGEEQTGPRSYRGRLTVRFHPQRVRDITGLAPEKAPQAEDPPMASDGMNPETMASDEGEPEITLAPAAEPDESAPAYLGPRYRSPVGAEPGQGRLPEWTRW